ncbi:HrpN-interacting protein from malus protein [Perilla frutescens var. hirtella]|uniref:HrpN-interacting protein from malus protein n=1 Tax=Perilla frutescens var. hirtella TaxID=608512 RepID=A0AAD4JKH5_PERFH|nr:HrpN-interacting protein from malus protein [Perilla frutescens var. frutescens]KAH6775561.1 HrpN-interacting protein from malus protein [Perilla frutescens var. hirtella]KAH6795635.1 hypothetical protein C2S51_036621 [Perilla frutescens var. frutescens]KAH6835529.1 HrpN-interacting protein from malus protein [Perilla frutescens var. hirtella]
MGYFDRGVIGDKWSSRILWLSALGSAVGLYMVMVERQLQNREKKMMEALRAAESGTQDGE